jgi:hypothetical protein
VKERARDGTVRLCRVNTPLKWRKNLIVRLFTNALQGMRKGKFRA